MRSSKKFSLFFFSWLFLTVLAVTVWAASNHAYVRSAEIVMREEAWYLQADLDLQMGRGLEDALHKGIALTFLYEFQLTKPQKYWFDDEVLTERKTVVLSYHALTRQYLLQAEPHQKAFDNLLDAKRELAQIRDWRVSPKLTLEKGESYQAALKMHLNRSKLPKALQVDSLGEADWELVTPTFSWWLKEGVR